MASATLDYRNILINNELDKSIAPTTSGIYIRSYNIHDATFIEEKVKIIHF